MPVVRVYFDKFVPSDEDAKVYAAQQAKYGNADGVEILTRDHIDWTRFPDPHVVSGIMRTAADYAVMFADAVDKIIAGQSVKRDVTP